jgi:hypothetical protein
MGSSDRTGKFQHNGVSQEIVLVSFNDSYDLIETFKKRLSSEVLERLQFRWDTWKGLYVTPPYDDLPWSLEEHRKIETLFKSFPEIQQVDSSPGGGSVG